MGSRIVHEAGVCYIFNVSGFHCPAGQPKLTKPDTVFAIE